MKELRQTLERLRGKQQTLEQQLLQTQTKIKNDKRSLRKHERAREIVREVGLKTQQELQYHISDITSLALDAVFEDPYTLEAEFVERRGKTECDLWFVRNNKRIDPIDASGGGTVDIAAFALRVASWSMQTPHSRPTIILDEPLKNLSIEYQKKGSQMLKEVSEKLGIQFIIITHESVLAEYADKQFNTKLIKKVTTVS